MANESRGPEEMKVDSVSLIPSKKKKKKAKPTPNPSCPYDFVSSTPSISPPPAKKRKTSATPTLMSLPYELLLNCLARLSRLYYPTLSLVSKRFRSLLVSSDLYKIRSLMGLTESCLYVCMRSFCESPFESFWFTLCLKPGKDKGYVLARVPLPYSRYAWFPDLVVVGSSIYHIARSYCSLPPSVSILDCRSHTWREAPSMRVSLHSFTPCVLDRKIYVAGHGENGDNSIEVFDTKTETWDPEPIPCSDIYHGHYSHAISIGGKLYVVHSPHNDVYAYNYNQGRWDMVTWRSLAVYLGSHSYCEIDNVMYCVDYQVILWCDPEVMGWREVKGLVGLPELPRETPRTFVRLANYGGKMVVFWANRSPNYRYTCTVMIWCAVIALERRQSCEIWGQVEWCGHVLTSYEDLVKVLAVTL